MIADVNSCCTQKFCIPVLGCLVLINPEHYYCFWAGLSIQISQRNRQECDLKELAYILNVSSHTGWIVPILGKVLWISLFPIVTITKGLGGLPVDDEKSAAIGIAVEAG